MTLDKFGHYLNDTSRIISIRNEPQVLGFYMDADNNIDIQNKRIKNVANAFEENDAVNKVFLQTQLEKMQHEVIKDLKEQLDEIRKENINTKVFLEEQIEILNEKIYRFENYMFVSIANKAPANNNALDNIANN